jgi:regulator of sigma E protease
MVSLLVFLLVISVLVFVHELGHFLVAKHFGVGVKSFAIGFPPTLWKVKKGETEYKINAIPMGGYVSLVGELSGDEEDAGFKKTQYMNLKPWWQRLCILLAGVAMNFLFAAVVLVILSLLKYGWSGFANGFLLYMSIAGDVFWGLIQFLGGLFQGHGLGEVSGPVGIAKILGSAAEVSVGRVAFLSAILSINLGIMNLVPFPALDGGQIVFVLIEAITGKKVPAKYEGWVNTIGFGLLILLMIVVSVKDVKGLF